MPEVIVAVAFYRSINTDYGVCSARQVLVDAPAASKPVRRHLEQMPDTTVKAPTVVDSGKPLQERPPREDIEPTCASSQLASVLQRIFLANCQTSGATKSNYCGGVSNHSIPDT